MKLQGITFIATYRCNASCGHCFFGVSDSPYLAEHLIGRTFLEIGPLEWVHLSGGEPFLDPPELLSIISVIREHHPGHIGIATNGYWARDTGETAKLVSSLADQGVDGISFSVDVYHQRWVPLNRVITAAKAVRNAGMTNHSWIVASGDSAESLELARQASRESGLPLAENAVRNIGKGASRKGAGTGEIPQGLCRDLSCCLGETGPFDPKMLWIDPYGNVLICYGIIIGNVRDRSLNQIMEEYRPENNRVLSALAEEGPKGLYRLAEEKGCAPAGWFPDECALCFRSRRELRAYYPEILGPGECYP
ncbi:MAG: radical SAM/SPASM domain-containing protein [Spirochaetia bacterium]